MSPVSLSVQLYLTKCSNFPLGVGYVTWIWTSVECDLAIICISVPALRPLARKYLPSLWRQTSGDETSYSILSFINRRKAVDKSATRTMAVYNRNPPEPVNQGSDGIVD